MWPAFLTCLSDAGFDAVAEDVAFELSKNREHPCQGPTAGRGKVECLTERDETDVQ